MMEGCDTYVDRGGVWSTCSSAAEHSENVDRGWLVERAAERRSRTSECVVEKADSNIQRGAKSMPAAAG